MDCIITSMPTVLEERGELSLVRRFALNEKAIYRKCQLIFLTVKSRVLKAAPFCKYLAWPATDGSLEDAELYLAGRKLALRVNLHTYLQVVQNLASQHIRSCSYAQLRDPADRRGNSAKPKLVSKKQTSGRNFAVSSRQEGANLAMPCRGLHSEI